MPWVERHRRRLPHSWFRTTTVQAHHRRSPGLQWIAIGIAIVVIILLIAIF